MKPIRPTINMEDGSGVSQSAEAITKAIMYLADLINEYLERREWQQ